ncbi:MAG: magnesium transporter [Thermoplasmatales archaeon]|nr:magnesium transporter [Thermoplasmatales archaeon]
MSIKNLIRQSLPLLIILGIAEMFTGGILSSMASMFENMPGLIVIIPAIIDLRGNINSALGSRLGSAAHLGLIDVKKVFNKETKENVKASMVLSVVCALFLGFLAWLTSSALGYHVNVLALIIVTVIAGTLAGLILAFITVGIVIVAFRKGLDPDNITGPFLTTIGDIITVICLLGTVMLVGGI